MAEFGLALAAQVLEASGRVASRLKDLDGDDEVIAILLNPVLVDLDLICKNKAGVSEPRARDTLAVLEKDILEIEGLLSNKGQPLEARLQAMSTSTASIQEEIKRCRELFYEFEVSLLAKNVNLLKDRFIKRPKYTGTKGVAKGGGGAASGALVGSFLGPPGMLFGALAGGLFGAAACEDKVIIRNQLKRDLDNMRAELDDPKKHDPAHPTVMNLRWQVMDMLAKFVKD